MASMDFFTVPTATFRVLFVLVVLSHARRRIVHFAVTEHPTQEWTLQQLREAFPWNQSPQYLLRDRDAIYGEHLVAVIEGMGIEEVLTAPRSPWQNPYVERLVGSIRRECLDHIVVWNQRSLRSEEHTSELQSRLHLVCRLLLEKKKKRQYPQKLCLRKHYATRSVDTRLLL